MSDFTTTKPSSKADAGDTGEVEVVSARPTDTSDPEAWEAGFKDVDAKRLLWKIDLHLIPWLCVIYLFCFLDRVAIGNARLYGLEEDLGASDLQYRVALTVFFVPYAFIEPVTNTLIKRYRPSIVLSCVVMAWSIVLTLSGTVSNVSGLIATRFFLGLAEGALFPGVTFFMSCWYKRSEFGLRAAIFFSAASASGAFGGLLSVAFAQIGHRGGRAPWQWIFILLGLISFLVGFLSLWFCHDYPPTAKFLTPRERDFVVARLRADDQYTAAGGEKFQWRYLKDAFADPKVYFFALLYGCVNMPLYAISLTLPTIINNLGFDTPASANLMAVPVYIWACIFTTLVGFSADRTGYRGFYHLGFASISIVGFIILLCRVSFGVSYFATYLAAMGVYPLIANGISWTANNFEGQHKRALVMAIVVGFGNLNGMVSSNVYVEDDAPWYPLGHGLVLMYITIGCIAATVGLLYLRHQNRKKASGALDEIIEVQAGAAEASDKERVFASEEEARVFLGDRYSGFKYRL